MNGWIRIIGLGPGTLDWFPPGGLNALQAADVILGYHKYLHQIADILPLIPRESSGMRHEIERAQRAIDLAAQGKRVAVVSGGDAGIYGMAGLILEMLDAQNKNETDVAVLPGISALNAAAALLGAPLMTDFVAISLSDYLTPLETIQARLHAAIDGDFVICLYNPRSHSRVEPFNRALEILQARLDPQCPIGVVRAAYRKDQVVAISSVEKLSEMEVGMDTMIIVGNRSTRVSGGKMVTSRGYPIETKGGGEA